MNDYISHAFNRNSITLAAAMGMRELDTADLEVGVDTLCLNVRDFVHRIYISMPTGAVDVQITAILGLMENLIEVVEPRRVVISMQGPVVLQQLHVERIDIWQQHDALPLDSPGTSTCIELTACIKRWIYEKLSCVVDFCSPNIPGDGLMKIRQCLRLSPPHRDARTILYGRSNAHVLSSISMAPAVELDLLYVPPRGSNLFMAQPHRPELLPYLVIFDNTWLPSPDTGLLYDIIAASSTADINALIDNSFKSGLLAPSSYEDFLMHVRGKQPPNISTEDSDAYGRVVAALGYYYAEERTDSTLLYSQPILPAEFCHSFEIRVDNVYVLPTNIQLVLLLGGKTSAGVRSMPITTLSSQLPAPPGPLPLKALYRALVDMPTLVSDGMVSESITSVDRSGHGVKGDPTPIPINVCIAYADVKEEI